LRLLLDTNVLLWSIFERHKLTPRVRQLIDDDQSELVVSRTSIWEISAKAVTGRLPLLGNSVAFVLQQVALTGTAILELENRYILRTETLPNHHTDPFDRILVAQALEEGLTILTADSDIPKYDAPVIWK
jgi:PIN domain nuclease of toxin-antitoxin system